MNEIEKGLSPDITLVCKLDKEGKITFVNEEYKQVTGYSDAELIGQSHVILQHPQLPKVVQNRVWELIKSNQHNYFISKNLTKNKEFFWTIADINPKMDKGWKTSIFIRRKFLPFDVRSEFEKLYNTLYEIETAGGGEKIAKKYFNGWLEDRNVQTLSEYIIQLFGGEKKLQEYLTSEISDEELFTVDASELPLDEILKQVKKKKRRLF
jgi:PAS domain S-box-containing protein